MKTFKQFSESDTRPNKETINRDAKYAKAVATKNIKQQQRLVDEVILASGGFAEHKGAMVIAGAYDLLDGEIIEAVPYSQYKTADTHSKWLSGRSALHVNTGKAGLFIVTNSGLATWRGDGDLRGVSDYVKSRVRGQLKIIDRTPIVYDKAGNVVPLSARIDT